MAKNRFVIEERWPDKETARYKSLQEAQNAARPDLATDLAAILKDMLSTGELITRNGEIVPSPNYAYPKKKKEEIFVSIYALVDPRTQEIKYIGQTRQTMARLHGHIHNPHGKVIGWIDELRTAGLSPRMDILEIVKEKLAHNRERHWIKKLLKSGTIINTVVPKRRRT